MRRLLITSLLISLVTTFCGTTPTLWGTYGTPTPELSPTSLTMMVETPTLSRTPLETPTMPSTVTAEATPTEPTLAAMSTDIAPIDTPTSGTPPILYYTQSGDTLSAVAARFGIDVSEFVSPPVNAETSLINPGALLVIPDRLTENITPSQSILPDCEFVYSASALGFDSDAFVEDAGGYLSKYKEYLGSTGWATGARIIDRLALDNSINPRLLLAVLEYESKWVSGQPANFVQTDYPLNFPNIRYKGLYSQMAWAVQQLSVGYYGWRSGTLTEFTFPDGTGLRFAPGLNAGSVALQYFFSRRHNMSEWAKIMDADTGFPALYGQLFGDPWARAQVIEPLFIPDLTQPTLVLPFEPKREWNYTGGPHPVWGHEGAWAALDFAPSTDTGGCDESEKWIIASAPGLVVRTGEGVVVLDLDGDGREQTGWVLFYMHVATKDRVPLDTWINTDEHIGHASCEGGVTTGTHVHLARKYNGEWILADGPLPFNLSGWIAYASEKPYEGTLIKGDQTIIADPYGSAKAIIIRSPDE